MCRLRDTFMILSYASFIIVAYVLLRFVVPLPCGLVGKLALTVVLIGVSLKLYIYERVGGFLFAPDLPRPVILALEWLYAALLLLALLLLIRDAVALIFYLAGPPGCPYACRFRPTSSASGLLCSRLR